MLGLQLLIWTISKFSSGIWRKRRSKYGYFIQFQPDSDCYSAGHPYQFPSTAAIEGGKNSKLLRGAHERDERGSGQAGGGEWITVKNNIYCQH